MATRYLRHRSSLEIPYSTFPLNLSTFLCPWDWLSFYLIFIVAKQFVPLWKVEFVMVTFILAFSSLMALTQN